MANELSACEARHRQQLEQAEEQYTRNLATFRHLIDTKTEEVSGETVRSYFFHCNLLIFHYI